MRVRDRGLAGAAVELGRAVLGFRLLLMYNTFYGLSYSRVIVY